MNRTLYLWNNDGIVEYDAKTREVLKLRVYVDNSRFDRYMTTPFELLPVKDQEEVRAAIDRDMMPPEIPCGLTAYKREIESA